MNNRVEALDHYQQALKAGRKAHRKSVQQGEYPFLQVLDEILSDSMRGDEADLGLIEIPIDRMWEQKAQGAKTHLLQILCLCFPRTVSSA